MSSPFQFRRQYLAGKIILRTKSFATSSINTVLEHLASVIQFRYWLNKTKPLLINIKHSLGFASVQRSDLLEVFSLELWPFFHFD